MRRRKMYKGCGSKHSCTDDDLPDPGLPKTNSKDAKEKKKVAVQFPVDVKTNSGKSTGTGSVDLMDSIATLVLEKTPQMNMPKGELKKKLSKYYKHKDLTIMEKIEKLVSEKKQSEEQQKKPVDAKQQNKSAVENQQKKPTVEIQQQQKPADQNQQKKRVGKQQNKSDKKKKKKKFSDKKQVKPVVERLSKFEALKQAALAKEEIRKDIEHKKNVIRKAIEAQKKAMEIFEENNKVYKPDECMKHITMEMHPTLAACWYVTEATKVVELAGAFVVGSDNICDEGLIFWTRHVTKLANTEAEQVALAEMTQQCPRAVFLLPAEQLAVLARQGPLPAVQYVMHMNALAMTYVTVIVLRAKGFCINMPIDPATQAKVTDDRLSQMIVDLQIELMVNFRVDVFVVDSPKELGTMLLHFTRAIAETPYKRTQRFIDEQADFYMRGDNKNCVTVDAAGNGLNRLWEQMIAVLPQSSLEIARSLGAKHKNPWALFQEFQTAKGTAKVADIGIARSNVPGAKTRKLGAEFARKMRLLLTTEDPDLVIE